MDKELIDKEFIEKIYKMSENNLNYNILVIISSMISASGLLINDSNIILASMLISPIMGPILGMSVGLLIKDFNLIKKAIWSECIGILLCTVTGIIYGICSSFVYELLELPTIEIMKRGNFIILIFGFFIAIPSGIALVLAVLHDNYIIYIGVSISASLLPPLCNFGILCGLAFIKTNIPTLFVNNIQYSTYEFIISGIISLCLFIVNFICIFGVSFFMLKIKNKKCTYIYQ